MTRISFSSVDLTSPKTCLLAAFRTAVIPATKQNKLYNLNNFSTGRVFVQCDKSENTQLSILINIHFE